MAVQIQLRNDTAANWTSANPTLAAGEMGVETDTDQFKLGDGLTAWNSLGYGGIAGTDGDTGVVIQAEAPTNTNILWLDSDDPAGPILVPSGGTTGQVLAKASGDDYDSEWVTDADIPLSTVTAAGDLIVADGASSVTRLGIGAADQVLTSNGTTATWEDAGGGGFPSYTLITSATLSAETLSITSIPQDYDDLLLRIDFDNYPEFRINNISSSDYGFWKVRGNTGTRTSSQSAFFPSIKYGEILIPGYTTTIQDFTRHNFIAKGRDGFFSVQALGDLSSSGQTACTTITAAQTVTGTFELYGVTYA